MHSKNTDSHTRLQYERRRRRKRRKKLYETRLLRLGLVDHYAKEKLMAIKAKINNNKTYRKTKKNCAQNECILSALLVFTKTHTYTHIHTHTHVCILI